MLLHHCPCLGRTRQSPQTPSADDSLTGLPCEILLQILACLDSEALFHLALTCRTLHYLALTICLRRHGIRDPRNEIRVHSSNSILLRALCMATFIDRSNHFTWRAENADGWAKEVKHVKRFLSNTEILESISLDFSRVINLGRKDADAKLMNARTVLPLVKVAGSLLDLAARQCPFVQILNEGETEAKAAKRLPGERPLSPLKNPESTIRQTYTTMLMPGSKKRPSFLAFIPLPFHTHVLCLQRGNYRIRRLEVCDPSFFKNPAALRWLACWTRGVLLASTTDY